MKIKLFLGASILLLVSGQVNAAIVSFGNLSSNNVGSTEIITDTLNNREWLRWDILADLNYEETVSATTNGGAYSDYSIANQYDAALFVNALWGAGTDCTATANDIPVCGITTTDLTPLLGDNANQYYDFAWFLSDDGEHADTGY